MADASHHVAFRAALVQMCTSRQPGDNIAKASSLIRDAAKAGASYVQTPEVTNLMEMRSADLFAKAQPESGNEGLAKFVALAKDLGIWLHIGSMVVRLSQDKCANRAYLIAPNGSICASYDKIHMFDVELPGGERYRESKNYRPGNEAVVADLPWGRLGLTICYDMRFSALYQGLTSAGCDFIAVPSAFTVPTGRAHWHALLRARAIETQAFVLAAAQVGHHDCGRDTYGHSIIISPWGEVLAEGDGDAEGIVEAQINLSDLENARNRVPSLKHVVAFKPPAAAASAQSPVGVEPSRVRKTQAPS